MVGGGVAAAVFVVALAILFPVKERPPRVEPTEVRRPTVNTQAPTSVVTADDSVASSDPRAMAPPTSAGRPRGPAHAARPPLDGRYVYSEIATTDKGRSETVRSWLVTSEASEPAGRRVRWTSAEGADGGPTEESSEAVERWSETEVIRTQVVFPQTSNGRRSCEFEPALLRYPLPLEVGLEWESEAWCGTDKRRTKEQVSARVRGSEVIQIAGRQVFTFVLDLRTGRGLPEYIWVTEEGTSWFAPEFGVVVKSEAVRRETVNGGFEFKKESELLSFSADP